ncbi:MAG: FAD/NAD(P)-binding oxidoreductase, partial [Acutalibacteraceae bacterium]
VAGGGFIGLEAAENLKAQGVAVTVVDLAEQIMPNVLDPEMAAYAQKHLVKNGIRVLTGTRLEAVLGEGEVTGVKTDGGVIPADAVIMCIGIRPNTAFLAGSGIDLQRGLIVTDDQLRTNLPDVYAAGDCALVKNRITGAPQWSAMGSSANYEGRTLAQILAERKRPIRAYSAPVWSSCRASTPGAPV